MAPPVAWGGHGEKQRRNDAARTHVSTSVGEGNIYPSLLGVTCFYTLSRLSARLLRVDE
jgi:hypothetical protein